jgi:hypothetical protein
MVDFRVSCLSIFGFLEVFGLINFVVFWCELLPFDLCGISSFCYPEMTGNWTSSFSLQFWVFYTNCEDMTFGSI